MSRYDDQFDPAFSRLHLDRDLLWVVPLRVRYMIGVCGLRYSGKSMAVSHLVEKRRFRYYNVANTLRSIAAEYGVTEDSRADLQDLGDALRKDKGPDYLARRTLRLIRRDHLGHRTDGWRAARIAVSGFKRPEEAAVFARTGRFRLIGIASADAARLNRANALGLAADEIGLPAGTDVTARQFRERIDQRDRYGAEGDGNYGQAVEAVMASIPEEDRIVNDGNGPSLYRALDARVRELDLRYLTVRG